MRGWLLYFACLLPLSCTNYTVKAGGGGSFTTISACVGTAVAGDTCTVFAGSYAGWTQSTSGSSHASPITFTINPGDAVSITSQVTVSNVSHIIIGCPVAIGAATAGAPMAATTSNGPFGSFKVGGCFNFVNAGIVGGGSGTPTVDVVVSYNNVTGSAPPVFFNIVDGNGNGSTDNVVSHNKYLSSANAPFCNNFLHMFADRTLIEYNDVSGTGDDFIDPGGANLVVRWNWWHDNNQNVSLGCAQSPEHADFVQLLGGATSPPLTFTLIEHNAATGCTNDGGNCHGIEIIRNNSAADTIIARYNYAQNIDGDCINHGGSGDNVPNGSDYNNTCATEHLATYNASFDSVQGTTTNTNVLNNIAYNVEAPTGGPCPCFPFAATAPGIENGNLAFNSAGSIAWPSPYNAEATYSALANKDPKFANYPTDGTLQGTSPAIAAGVALTTANGSGSTSTALVATNAHVFAPGWAGTAADWIRVGASTTVQISSINYSTNTLTLANAISWSNGDSIYLYKDSNGAVVLNAAAPDVGAFPFVASGGSISGGIATMGGKVVH